MSVLTKPSLPDKTTNPSPPLNSATSSRNPSPSGEQEDLLRFLRFHLPPGASVLAIGAGAKSLLSEIKVKQFTAVDLEEESSRPLEERLQSIDSKEKFDTVVLIHVLAHLRDIQNTLNQLKQWTHPDSRLIILSRNYLWSSLIRSRDWRGPAGDRSLNWLSPYDVQCLLNLSGYELISQGSRFLLPAKLPLLSRFVNAFLVKLPIFNRLGLTQYYIARTLSAFPAAKPSVSVIVPARNEKGNIESVLQRMPRLGGRMEIIFVEGHSRDETYEEILRVQKKYHPEWEIKVFKQTGEGKANAVWKGFEEATGDFLMILDADLTTPAEELPKFYDALLTGKGEFVMGSRLVYPLEKDSMRFLNILGNKFFSLILSWILEVPIKDTLCGTKVLSRRHYQQIQAGRGFFGPFDPFGDFDLIFGAAKLHLKIVEIPIRYQARSYGKPNIRRFYHAWLLLRTSLFAFKKFKLV